MLNAAKAFVRSLRGNDALLPPNAMMKGRVIEQIVEGAPIRWLIANRGDEIQARQISDGFYELPELRQLRQDIGARTAVLDVGANIGNHSIFFIRFMGCKRLVCIEPFHQAYQHLLANLALNVPAGLDLRVIAAGLGRAEGKVSLVAPSKFNIGLTKIDLTEGDVSLMTADRLIGEQPVDLVKIDVEGMELDVLAGMTALMSRQRPAVYIETSEATRNLVTDLIINSGYALVRHTVAYETQLNLTFMPQ